MTADAKKQLEEIAASNERRKAARARWTPLLFGAFMTVFVFVLGVTVNQCSRVSETSAKSQVEQLEKAKLEAVEKVKLENRIGALEKTVEQLVQAHERAKQEREERLRVMEMQQRQRVREFEKAINDY